MKKLLFPILSLMAGFIAGCGGGYGGDLLTSSASALFGEASKALKPAQAQCTITVSDSNGNGSIDNEDIQTALDTARTNNQDDVVCIPAGTYNITSTLTYDIPSDSSECGKKLTIRADGGSVILDGGNSVQILSINTSKCSDDANGDITIEGINFQNGRTGYVVTHGGGLFVNTKNANVTLINNIFIGNRANGYGGGAFVVSNSGSITIANNTFSRNSAFFSDSNVYSHGGGGFVESNFGSITLINNTFIGNRANGYGGGVLANSNFGSITLINNTFSNNSASLTGGGADVSSSSGSITLTNNTFSNNNANNYGGGAYVYLENDTATLNFYNNILWNNTANPNGNNGDDLYVDNDGDGDNTPSPVNLAHNLFSTTAIPIDFSTAPQTQKVYIWLTGNYNRNIANGCTNSGNFGNIQADPLFVDPQNGDLRLQANSPAIDVGCNNAPSIPSTDKDGNQRIVSTAVDMGAYEYQGQQQDEQQGGGQSQPQPQPGNGQTGGGGGGCSMGGTADASMLWWLVPPVLALARRLRRSIHESKV
ncbi:MAG: choice-of-anchor Q domain-containing protein [Thermoproteota archaeon]